MAILSTVVSDERENTVPESPNCQPMDRTHCSQLMLFLFLDCPLTGSSNMVVLLSVHAYNLFLLSDQAKLPLLSDL